MQDEELISLAIDASCQRLRAAQGSVGVDGALPELLRIMKLLQGYGSNEKALLAVHSVPAQLWQPVVPQLFSLLISPQVGTFTGHDAHEVVVQCAAMVARVAFDWRNGGFDALKHAGGPVQCCCRDLAARGGSCASSSALSSLG